MKIRIKQLDSGAPIAYKVQGDWIDLSVTKDIVMKAPEATTLSRKTKNGVETQRRKVIFDRQLIDLNACIEMPKGFECHMLPRSSTPLKWNIILGNSEGAIDGTYIGDSDIWRFYAIAFDDVCIPAGTSIAQFRIDLSQRATVWQKLRWLFSNEPKIEIVQYLGNKSRGGHGTTGDR